MSLAVEDLHRRKGLLHDIREQQESIRAQLAKRSGRLADLDTQLRLEDELEELIRKEARVEDMLKVNQCRP